MSRGPQTWHVWFWNGEAFQLVWNDLTTTEARDMIEWRNEKFQELGETVYQYVIAGVDEEPTLA